MAVVDQVLTMSTGHEAQSQSRNVEVDVHDPGDGQMILER